jgi:hypothetical protein
MVELNCMRKGLFPVALAVAGFAAIAVGIHQGLVHVAPGYEGTITSGWGGDIGHEERLLAAVGAVGVGGAAVSRRWARLSVVPAAAGGVVLFYALRAVLGTALDVPLYAETTTYGGDPVAFVLGAEPFLLVAGGVLLVGAGVAGWRRRASRETDSEVSPTTSTTSG